VGCTHTNTHVVKVYKLLLWKHYKVLCSKLRITWEDYINEHANTDNKMEDNIEIIKKCEDIN
jgi:hypothetical protein